LAKVELEKLDQNRVRLSIEVDVAAVDAALEHSYQQVSRRVNIPGFRRGKAPRSIVERYAGQSTILEGALDELLAPSYSEALTEQKVEPVDQPEVDIVEFEAGKPLKYTATVTVKPEVTLGQYTGLGIAKEVREVTDADVDTQLNQLRERSAQIVPADDAELANGLTGIIDFEGFLGDEPFAGGKGNDFSLEIGSGTFIPGFEEQLVGMKKDETRDIKVTFPADYRAAELAGKDAHFVVSLKEIKKKELPELNDDFAKGLGSFETIDALRETVKNNLVASAEEEAKSTQINTAVNKVIEASTVELPDVMVNHRLDSLVEDVSRRMQSQGLTMEQYCQSTGKTMDDVRTDMRPQAVQSIKRDLVLEAIAKQENIEISDADIELEIGRMAEMYGTPAAEIRKVFEQRNTLGDLRDSLRTQKAIEFIIAHV
jgi:trigger factor